MLTSNGWWAFSFASEISAIGSGKITSCELRAGRLVNESNQSCSHCGLWIGHMKGMQTFLLTLTNTTKYTRRKLLSGPFDSFSVYSKWYAATLTSIEQKGDEHRYWKFVWAAYRKAGRYRHLVCCLTSKSVCRFPGRHIWKSFYGFDATTSKAWQQLVPYQCGIDLRIKVVTVNSLNCAS